MELSQTRLAIQRKGNLMMPESNDPLQELESELQKELKERDREPSGDEGSGILPSGQARIGVLMRLLSAVKDEKEYRQQLLTSDFIDDEEADRVAAAIAEANRYGLSLTPIIDWCAARCSVNKHGHGKSRAVLGIEGLTHSTFTTLGRNYRDREKQQEGEKSSERL